MFTHSFIEIIIEFLLHFDRRKMYCQSVCWPTSSFCYTYFDFLIRIIDELVCFLFFSTLINSIFSAAKCVNWRWQIWPRFRLPQKLIQAMHRYIQYQSRIRFSSLRLNEERLVWSLYILEMNMNQYSILNCAWFDWAGLRQELSYVGI